MKKIIVSMAVILLALAALPAPALAGRGVKDLGSSAEKRGAKRNETAAPRDGRVLRLRPSETYLKNGLRIDEVVRLLGEPATRSERRVGDKRLSTYTFQRSEGRILVAEFEDGLLVASRTEIPEELGKESRQ